MASPRKKWPHLEKKGQAEKIFTINRMYYDKRYIQNPFMRTLKKNEVILLISVNFSHGKNGFSDNAENNP